MIAYISQILYPERKNLHQIFYPFFKVLGYSLDKFIEKAGEAELIFFVSPFWRGMNADVLAPVKERCKQHGIKLIDNSNNPKYLKKTELFNDYAHLNAKGADLYTQDVIQELKAK